MVVYRFTLSDGGAKPELLISIKKEYQGKPLYEKGLQRQFDAHHDEEHPYLLRYVEMRDVDGLGRCLVVDWEDARPCQPSLLRILPSKPRRPCSSSWLLPSAISMSARAFMATLPSGGICHQEGQPGPLAQLPPNLCRQSGRRGTGHPLSGP